MVGVMEGRMTLRAFLRGLRWWAVRSVTGVQVGAGIAVMASKAVLVGPRPGRGQPQPLAPAAAGESGWDMQEPVAQRLRLARLEGVGQRQEAQPGG